MLFETVAAIQFMESHLYSNAKVNPSYWTLELTPKLLTKIFQSLTNGNRSSAVSNVVLLCCPVCF